MEIWDAVVANLTSPVGEFGQRLMALPPWLAIGLLALPALLAAVSRRFLAVAGTALLATAVPIILTAPAMATTVIAAECYIGAMIIAVSAILSWRSDRATKAEMAQLRAELNRLLEAETHRILVELKSVQHAPRLSPNDAAADTFASIK
jgi:hypothetical protein